MKLTQLIPILILALLPCALSAKEPESTPDPFELTIEENLTPPKMSNRQRDAARQRMNTVYSELQRHKFNVVKSHDGLVVTVAIPCANLFAPNDTTAIMPQANALLKSFLNYAEKADMYRIVISVHSDNTGSEEYRYDLTDARANLICDFLEKNAPHAAAAQTIIPYGLGHEEKIAEDDSIRNRSRNRRVEISIVAIK